MLLEILHNFSVSISEEFSTIVGILGATYSYYEVLDNYYWFSSSSLNRVLVGV